MEPISTPVCGDKWMTRSPSGFNLETSFPKDGIEEFRFKGHAAQGDGRSKPGDRTPETPVSRRAKRRAALEVDVRQSWRSSHACKALRQFWLQPTSACPVRLEQPALQASRSSAQTAHSGLRTRETGASAPAKDGRPPITMNQMRNNRSNFHPITKPRCGQSGICFDNSRESAGLLRGS